MEIEREVRTVQTRDSVELGVLRLQRRSLPPRAASVLLVHGFAQNCRGFDAPGRSVAEHLATAGLAVYLGDLRGHGRSRGPFTVLRHSLARHVEQDVPAMVQAIRRERPTAPVLLLGHSMGGLVGALLAAEVTASLAGMCLVCPAFHVLAAPDWLRAPLWSAAAVARRVWPLPLWTNLAGPALHLCRWALDHPRFPMPFPVWSPGSLDPPVLAHALLNTFEAESPRVLAELLELGTTGGERCGTLPVASRLEALRTPVLMVAAGEDGLAPVDGVTALFNRVGSPSKRMIVFGKRDHRVSFGHVDILVGHRAPELVWPTVTEFLLQHTGAESDHQAGGGFKEFSQAGIGAAPRSAPHPTEDDPKKK